MAGALNDVKVLDLTRVLSGPYCAMWLGDMGADVIKIEMPVNGDDARRTPIHLNGNSTFFAAMNRNKKGITLNLKDSEGKKIFKEMVKKSDVILSNFRPGVMEKMGLGYEELKKIKEDIIYAQISGFGKDGEYSQRPAYDIVAQGMGGIMATTGSQGEDPTRVGASIADITAGMNCVVAILAALHYRDVSGKGQAIDISMVDSVIALMPSENMRYFISGHLVPRLGNRYVGNAPYGAFKAKDAPFIIACGSDKLFAKFCNDVLHRPELPLDERYSIMSNRSDNYNDIKEFVETWASQYTAKECVKIILDAGIPAGPINTMDEISKDDFIVNERKMLLKMEQPGIGELTVTNCPIHLCDTAPEIRMPAPLLGQHNEEIYKDWLGYDKEKIDELKSKGII